MSDTPRTEAVLSWLNLPDGRKIGIPTVLTDLCQQLERELAEVVQDRAGAHAARERAEAALRAARPEEKPSVRIVSIGLLDALKDQKQCDPDGIECQVSRQAVDEAIAILERMSKGGRWCTISYAHMPHDTCDGSAAPSPRGTLACAHPHIDFGRCTYCDAEVKPDMNKGGQS